MRVLLAEDHEELARRGVLRREGMAVDVVYDGADALYSAAVSTYDVVILDRDLPEVHGDDVCRALAASRSASRVLMLTAAGTVEDRVDGLVLGSRRLPDQAVRHRRADARIRALGRALGAAASHAGRG